MMLRGEEAKAPLHKVPNHLSKTMPLLPSPAAKRRTHPTHSSWNPTSPTTQDQDALSLSLPGEILALFQARTLQRSF